MIGVNVLKNKEKEIKNRILKLLVNTSYNLVDLRYDYKTFGNITIKIAGVDEEINIVTDRGEVYFNNKGVFFPLVSPLEVDTIEIIISVLLRDYLMKLRKTRDLSEFKLTE